VSLLDQAKADLRSILENDQDFAVPIVVTNPDGVSANLKGLQTDHALTIDPETGMAVTGSNASVALSILALQEAGIGMPRAISAGSKLPWLVEFTTPTGDTQKFKVSEALPDKLGCLVCRLEAWKE
jgi:hypothetical protein